MKLIETKEALNRLQKKYGPLFAGARDELRPDYGNSGNGGYYYGGQMDDHDRDACYLAISYLKEIFNNPDEVMYFDLKYYITEQTALNALDKVVDEISLGLENFLKMHQKYGQRGTIPYPITTILDYLTEISEHLIAVCNTQEVKEFRSPDRIKKMSAELSELQFSIYWKEYKKACIIHLACFFPFLALAIYAIIQKENKSILGLNKLVILAGVGIITILFNLLFNNHDYFKNSWKLFRKSTREKLKKTQKEKFLKDLKID